MGFEEGGRAVYRGDLVDSPLVASFPLALVVFFSSHWFAFLSILWDLLSGSDLGICMHAWRSFWSKALRAFGVR